MNAVDYALIDVSAVIAPTTSFHPALVEALALEIVKCGGLVRPLVVRIDGINRETLNNNYVLISGDLEYFAACRAKELDPTNFELVGAMVVKNDCSQQLALL